jgi:hypothetical protein
MKYIFKKGTNNTVEAYLILGKVSQELRVAQTRAEKEVAVFHGTQTRRNDGTGSFVKVETPDGHHPVRDEGNHPQVPVGYAHDDQLRLLEGGNKN